MKLLAFTVLLVVGVLYIAGDTPNFEKPLVDKILSGDTVYAYQLYDHISNNIDQFKMTIIIGMLINMPVVQAKYISDNFEVYKYIDINNYAYLEIICKKDTIEKSIQTTKIEAALNYLQIGIFNIDSTDFVFIEETPWFFRDKFKPFSKKSTVELECRK